MTKIDFFNQIVIGSFEVIFEPYKVVTKIGERNSRILFEALTRPEPRIRASDDLTGRQKAKDFYKSCQNIRILNEKGKFWSWIVWLIII